MKTYKYTLIFGLLFAIILSACGVDRQLGYQAVLTGPGGIPVANGTYDIQVKFWKSPTSTNSSDLVYTDTQTVTVTNGILNIAIPDDVTQAANLDPALLSQQIWVEFAIKGPSDSTFQTLSPRQKLLGTPYAFTLVGGSVINLKLGDQAPLVSSHPNRGALTVINQFNNNATNSPGTTGLVVAIADTTQSEVIRACAGGANENGCTTGFVVFKVTGNGNVQADGTYTSPASDYAEMILFDGDPTSVEPGDVLAISPTLDRAVVKSSLPNDNRLVGVYSTQPGFLGGRVIEGDDQSGFVPVAVVGIVPVKVSAINGPIQRGDLLTTSSIPGYAMKATDPQPGAILGKAMGELLEGEGVIEVYLLPH